MIKKLRGFMSNKDNTLECIITFFEMLRSYEKIGLDTIVKKKKKKKDIFNINVSISSKIILKFSSSISSNISRENYFQMFDYYNEEA